MQGRRELQAEVGLRRPLQEHVCCVRHWQVRRPVDVRERRKLQAAATTAPAGPHFAAAAAALRQEAEEAKQQAALRKNERLERAKTENYRRRESGSGRESGPGRLSDGPIRVMTPLTKAPVSPKSSPLVDGPFESSC